ncbi:hypothetical protein Pcinc_004297 [Petrolisthes cinctipes]|uniref:Uncharacterized protein n=1 Tax=Petrolisthes cinctipes TaxID=88211 RepID=A0AAE1GHC6_PETCI|nr:hypothetical protein Pcinc_004297 [Petrolisthes cinctipes]
MDAYLLRFERYVTTQGLEKSRWAVTLGALLTGKALETYCRLDEDDGIDNKKVKAALLKRFQLTAEGYRKKLPCSKAGSGGNSRTVRNEDTELFNSLEGDVGDLSYIRRYVENNIDGTIFKQL